MIGRTDHLAISTGEQRTIFLCYDCSTEFNDYTMATLKQIPDGLSQQQQIEGIQRLRQDAEQHMKQWVSDKGSR
jgi:hypothetical protein